MSQSVVQGKSVSLCSGKVSQSVFRESESVCGSGKVSQCVVQGK